MLNGIQVARGVAALLVVLYHSSVWSDVYYHTVFNRFFNFGYIGVDFFFVLSGFIIFYIHKNDCKGFVSWKKYFIKRIIRIYPPFIPISALLLLVTLYYPDIAKGSREIGILPSIFLIPTKHFPALDVAWTLMHEMLFYIFFSLYFFCRNFFVLISALWVILILNIDNASDNYLFDFLLNVHNVQFFFGVTVAFAVYNYNKLYKELFAVGVILIILFIFGSYFQLDNVVYKNYSVKTIYLGMSFSFIVYGIYGIDRYLSISYPFIFIFLGSASYSIYLIHYPLVSVFNRITSLLYPQIISMHHLIFIIIVFLCICLGILYHLFYEKKVTHYLRSKFI